MAKYVTKFPGNYYKFRDFLQEEILKGSMSASLEETHEETVNGVCCQVQTYERYSVIGGNRVSLNIVILESDGIIHLVATASGGSQAVFFKINTFGEEAFLDMLREAVERFKQDSR
ncbi:MAG: DUF6054 family protein [Oscillospiraceae bacterium]